jgi:SAM-dependent methyltransferase
MSKPFFSCHFLIAGNSRIAFEGAASKVQDFIAARLGNISASLEFCANWSSLEVRVRELLKDSPERFEFLVLLDAMNPFTDLDLIQRMTEILQRTQSPFCLCDGAVPGTEARAVLYTARLTLRDSFSLSLLESGNGSMVRADTQFEYNTQLNLYKYKRLKLFLLLIEEFPELYRLTVPELMHLLSSNEVFALLARFGNDVRQIYYKSCPHCEGELHSLKSTMSQPMCGYLPVVRPLYHECESCGLVVQSPSIHEDDVHAIYDKWDKQDFVTSTNNPFTTDSIRCDLTKIISSLPDVARTLDLGGGIGNFSKFLHAQYPAWEVTHSDFEIKSDAPEGVRSRTLDFTRNQIGKEQYDLITAWEVIEHVPYHKLKFIFKNIWEALAPGGFFVFSTPDFDSPVCKSFDFYAICPPFHYLVFGESWLRRYFDSSADFEVFDIKHCSDFLDDALNWYGYGAKTSPSMALRGTAQLLKAIFECDKDNRLKNSLTAVGMGTEIIMTLRKRSNAGI